jgi:phenol 2-monooxygenase
MTVEINLATTPMDQPSVETNTHEKLPSDTDVLIIGAGPIGLLCAYQLSKFSRGKIRVVVVGQFLLHRRLDVQKAYNELPADKEEKSTLPIYGRACTILPRTLEMWDQLGILDEMLDEGVVSKTGYNFKERVSNSL